MDEKIDLSKYEGHQPAPWRWVKPTEEWFLYAERGNHANLNHQGTPWRESDSMTWGRGIWLPDTFCRLGKGLDPTHRDLKSTYDLIADAPLLLEEVKRLRKRIEGYKAIWDYLDPKGYAWREEEFVALTKEHGFSHLLKFHLETGDD